MMKRIWAIFILSAMALCLLAGCGSGSNSGNSDPSCADILNDVISKDENGWFDTLLSAGNETLENNYDNMYAIKRDMADDLGILYKEEGGLANELSLFHIKDHSDVKLAKEKLEDRLATRRNQFAGYKPEEVYKLDNAVIMSQGNFVALIITDDPSMTESVLRQCISDNK